MTIFRFSAALAAAISLQACSQRISEEDLICSQSPGLITTVATSADEQVEVTEMCIHKWAYRLGRAPGSNSEIARSVIGACRDAIEQTLAMKVTEGNEAKQHFTNDAWHLFEKRFEQNAMFRVAQGRAGNCSIRGIDQK